MLKPTVDHNTPAEIAKRTPKLLSVIISLPFEISSADTIAYLIIKPLIAFSKKVNVLKSFEEERNNGRERIFRVNRTQL